MTSDLSQHEEGPEDPMELLNQWYKEVTESGHLNPRAMCFSTATKDGSANGRHLLLRRIDSDGIVIVTDGRSEKSAELKHNPQAAAAFLWIYKSNDRVVSRQIRMKGKITDLPEEEVRQIYDNEPLFCKIRAHICHQGQPEDWEKLKNDHDRVKEENLNGKNDLAMPKHYVGYKLTPIMFDFYHSADEYMIADRLSYTKDNDDWIKIRMQA